MESNRDSSMVDTKCNNKVKPKFKYYAFGYWRGVDKLGRTSGFYTWKMLWKMYDKRARQRIKERYEKTN